MDWYSAVLLNLTQPLADSSWISVPQLQALKVPILAIGAPEDYSSFPAIKILAADLLFRPFLPEELVVRIGRALAPLAQMPPKDHQGAQRKIRVVIADDDPAIIRLTSGMMRSKGFDCHEAKDGRQALLLARTLLPELLILDVNMPFVNGLDVLFALRDDPSTSAMKILLFTAADGPDEVRLGIQLGASSYLRKPFRPFDFLQHVNELLTSWNPDVEKNPAHVLV